MSDSEGVPSGRQRVLRDGGTTVANRSELELRSDEELFGDERTVPPARQSPTRPCEHNVL